MAGDPAEALPRGGIRMIRSPSGTTLVGSAVTVARLVALLQGQSGRIIIDQSDFKGLFDINLPFSPASAEVAGANDAAAPSLFTAIQALGLKLESGKAPLDVVVIERVERPTEN